MKTKEEMMNKKIELSEIMQSKVLQVIINILFGISVAGLNFMLIEQKLAENYMYFLFPIASFIIAEILAIKFKFLQKTFEGANPLKLIAVAGISAFFVVYTCGSTRYKEYFELIKIVSIIAIPAVLTFLYWFYKKAFAYLKKYIQTADKVEKNFLTIALVALIISVIMIYHATNIFYAPKPIEGAYKVDTVVENSAKELTEKEIAEIRKIENILVTKENYDNLFTTDTGVFLQQDVYNNIIAEQNDGRQPLFGVFAMPICIVPKMLSYMLPFIPNMYAILLAIIQGILTFMAFTLLARMMNLQGKKKGFFLVLATTMFSTIFFVVNLEQYVISFFYLILFLYMVMENKKEKDLGYILATGATLTSGIWFPLLGEKKNFKQSVKNIAITFLKCMMVFILSARIILFFPTSIQELNAEIQTYAATEKYTIQEKAYMYSKFIKDIFGVPESVINKEYISSNKLVKLDETTAYIKVKKTVFQQKVPTGFSIVGIGLLITAIMGFILNRKDKFAKICFIWAMFSFVLLFLLGWGTAENGLFLYSFYFGWAFLCLIYKLIESICKKHEKIQYGIYSIAIITMLLVNLPGMWDIIQFGMQYYSY